MMHQNIFEEFMLGLPQPCAGPDPALIAQWLRNYLQSHPKESHCLRSLDSEHGLLMLELLDLLLAEAAGRIGVRDAVRAMLIWQERRKPLTEQTYRTLVATLIAAMATLAGPRWSPEALAAWDASGDRLIDIITAYLADPGSLMPAAPH